MPLFFPRQPTPQQLPKYPLSFPSLMPTTTPTSYLYRQWLNPPSPPSTPKSRHPSLPFLPTLSPPPQRWIARCTSRCASAWSPLRWWSMSTRGAHIQIPILVLAMRCDAMRCLLRYYVLESWCVVCYATIATKSISYRDLYLSIDLIDNATTTTTPFPPFDETNTHKQTTWTTSSPVQLCNDDRFI